MAHLSSLAIDPPPEYACCLTRQWELAGRGGDGRPDIANLAHLIPVSSSLQRNGLGEIKSVRALRPSVRTSGEAAECSPRDHL